MKVLLLHGSPRRKGNTEVLLTRIAQGVEAAGGVSELVRLPELDIHPCRACGGCDKRGRCVIDDDMQGLYDKIDTADRIVIASPIYFYAVSAQTKAFIDRCQALWVRKYLLGQQAPGRAGVRRLGFLLSVSATKGERVFESTILSVRYAFDAMGLDYGGELLVRGKDARGVVADSADDLVRALAFGRDTVCAD